MKTQFPHIAILFLVNTLLIPSQAMGQCVPACAGNCVVYSYSLQNTLCLSPSLEIAGTAIQRGFKDPAHARGSLTRQVFAGTPDVDRPAHEEFSVEAGFPMHVRPLKLLGVIAQAIKRERGPDIYLSVRRIRDKQFTIDFEQPLHELAENPLTLHKLFKSLLVFLREEFEDNGTVLTIREPHEYVVKFDAPQADALITADIRRVLQNFFTNTLTRDDGMPIDVSFNNPLSQDLAQLRERDVRRILNMLGFGSRTEEVLSRLDYGLPDPKPVRPEPIFPAWMFNLIVAEHTPDYKSAPTGVENSI